MLFVLLGRSGSGKSTILKKLVDITGFNEIVTYTTRPIREKEQNGVDYHFVTDKEFEDMLYNEQIVAYQYIEDRKWHYGMNVEDIRKLSTNQIKEDEHAIVVATPSGYNELKDIMGKNVIGIYIDVEPDILIKRSLMRENKPDVKEMCRRFLSDDYDFSHISYDFKVTNNGKKVDDTVLRIYYVMLGVLYGSK